MANISGTSGDDTVLGTAGSDTISAKAGDDTVYGGAGNDNLDGGNGDDTLYGGADNDSLNGGTGDDILDGGSGSDFVQGGAGNDTAIYVVEENIGSSDRYQGGSGTDTIELRFLTLASWMSPAVQADIARYVAFLSQHSGQGEIGQKFQFTAFNLEVQQFEKLSITVDGIPVDPVGNDAPIITGADDEGGVTELPDADPNESTALLSDTGTITFIDFDLTGGHTVTVTPDSGSYVGNLVAQVTDSAAGDGSGGVTWTFSVQDVDVEHLGEGDTLTQTYTIAISDGAGGVASQTVTITITGTGDAPVIAAGNDSGDVGEDADAFPLQASGNLDSTDVDVGDDPAWSVSTAAAYGTAAIDATTGAWTYDLDNSHASVQGLGEGDTLTDSFIVTVTDEDGLTDTRTVTITITGTGDAPVIDLNSGTAGIDNVVTFTEDAGAINIAAAGTVSDADDTNLQSMTITLTNRPDGSAETLSLSTAAATAAVGLTVGAYNSTTGQLTISGSATLATYQTILQGILYNNTDQDPDPANRLVTATVSDGTAASTLATTTITVTPVNDAPTAGDDLWVISTNTEARFDLTTLNDFDLEGDALTYTFPTQTNDGRTLTQNGDGTVSYTAASGVGSGSHDDFFDYTVSDGTTSLTARVYIDWVNANSGFDLQTYVNPLGPYTASWLDGGGGGDVLNGGSGFDYFLGGSGNDTLVGGENSDQLQGGTGKDTLTGGLAADAFIFNTSNESASGSNRDVITDFITGLDKIDLSAIDAKTQAGFAGDQAFAFVAAQTSSIVANSITWHQSGENTFIHGDVDGNGVADFEIELTGLKDLTAADFDL